MGVVGYSSALTDERMECAKTSERSRSAVSEPSWPTDLTLGDRQGYASEAGGYTAPPDRLARAVQAREVTTLF